jgi:hypothetical protein
MTTNQTPEHQHHFIPTVYKFVGYQPRYDGDGHVTIAPDRMVVTRMQCRCGEEWVLSDD